jgi:hypothetical protein
VHHIRSRIALGDDAGENLITRFGEFIPWLKDPSSDVRLRDADSKATVETGW